MTIGTRDCQPSLLCTHYHDLPELEFRIHILSCDPATSMGCQSSWLPLEEDSVLSESVPWWWNIQIFNFQLCGLDTNLKVHYGDKVIIQNLPTNQLQHNNLTGAAQCTLSPYTTTSSHTKNGTAAAGSLRECHLLLPAYLCYLQDSHWSWLLQLLS